MTQITHQASRLPISAIVIYRNESDHLKACLPGLRFCDEIIGIDMASDDDSRAVAARYVDRMFEVDPFPIAEPTRVAAAKIAKHDWVMLVDPDEYLTPKLARQIEQALRDRPFAGGFGLPWWFYFKKKHLQGTAWGGTHRHKLMLIHRERCDLFPTCNRIVEVRRGFKRYNLPGDPANHVRHHWSNSYLNLLGRHWSRYPRLDVKRRRAEGERFSLKRLLLEPGSHFSRSYRDFDGCRMGLRGLLLSTVFGLYHFRQEMLMATSNDQTSSEPQSGDDDLPALRECTCTSSCASPSCSQLQSSMDSSPFLKAEASQRVLVISAAFPPMVAGESESTIQHCRALAAAGHEVHLLTTQRQNITQDQSFTVHATIKRWDWSEARELKRVVRAVKPQAVLLVFASWNYRYHPMISYAASMVKRIVPDCRFVTRMEWSMGTLASEHGLGTRLMRWWKAWRHRGDYGYGTLLRESDAVTVMCDEHEQKVAAIDPSVSEKLLRVPPLLLIRQAEAPTWEQRRNIRASLGVTDEQQTLLAYFGLIAPGKGLESLLRAMSELRTKGQDVKLVMIGGVTERPDHQAFAQRLQQLCRDMNLGSSVRWTGGFEFESMQPSQWLWVSDMAVLPWEQGARLNNSTLAAVSAHRLPIITTMPPEGQTDSELLVPDRMIHLPPGQVGRMVEAIDRVIQDAGLRRRLTVGSSQLFKQAYDPAITLPRTMAAMGLDVPRRVAARRAA